MARPDNYKIQASQAKALFLRYDQETLIRKFHLEADDAYLYTRLLSDSYRICRDSGSLERLRAGRWQDANSFAEVMTLLDLLCGSREDRFLTGRWKDMTAFGLMFHRNLLENPRDPWAEKFEKEIDLFRAACLALGGRPLPVGDAAYAMDFFDGLPIALQLWLGDEEFPANLRLMWDENAAMYLRYETMHFARGLILSRVAEEMEALRS